MGPLEVGKREAGPRMERKVSCIFLEDPGALDPCGFPGLLEREGLQRL